MIAKAILTPLEMNKTETAYAWMLQAQKMQGHITSYDFGLVTLRIGDDCRYTPDFMVVTNQMFLEFHEVKGGFTREDALVKLKAAAARYPFVFRLARFVNKEWKIEQVKP